MYFEGRTNTATKALPCGQELLATSWIPRVCVSLLLCLEGGFRNKSEKCWLAMLSLRPSLEPWIICVHPPFLCTVPHTSLSPGPTFCSGQPTICSQSLSPQCPLPTKILPILQGSLPAPLYEHCPPGRDTH